MFRLRGDQAVVRKGLERRELLRPGEPLRFFLFERDQCLEIREERSELALCLGLGPDLLRQGALTSQALDKFRGKFLRSAEIMPDLAQHGPCGLVPGFGSRIVEMAGGRIEPSAQEMFRLRGDQAVVGKGLERRELLRPGEPPSARHVGLLIPSEQRRRAGDVLNLPQACGQGLQAVQRLHDSNPGFGVASDGQTVHYRSTRYREASGMRMEGIV